MAAAVETTNVVITEPSEALLPEEQSEKPCFTKKHLYIAIGVVFVVAISLIGSLLDFSPEDNQVTEATIAEGTLETFPEFDTNNDGYIDRAEFSEWSAQRIAARKDKTTTSNPEPECVASNGTVCKETVDEHFSPIDLNHDGRISKDEAIAFAVRLIRLIFGFNQNGAANTQAIAEAPSTQCTVPVPPAFPGRRRGGWVGACRRGMRLWCFSSPFCRNRKKCHKAAIPTEYTTTDTCCGTTQAANCTQCNCGSSYTFVPEGKQMRLRAYCHWLAEYMCDDNHTGVTCW
jgi:hypothetical protein